MKRYLVPLDRPFVMAWMVEHSRSRRRHFKSLSPCQYQQIYVGEVPAIEEITENKTDHLVYAGWGEGGPVVELINSKGEDISLHVLGNERRDTDNYLRPPVKKLEPGYHIRGLWHIRAEQGYLAAGVYKLRIHRLDFKNGDIKAGAEVYSNTVTLNVVP